MTPSMGSEEALAAGWLVYLCTGLDESKKKYTDPNKKLRANLANYTSNNQIVSLEAITVRLQTF